MTSSDLTHFQTENTQSRAVFRYTAPAARVGLRRGWLLAGAIGLALLAGYFFLTR